MTTDQSDTELLVRRSRRGDSEAFQELVTELEKPLRSFLRAQTSAALARRVDVADLLQETLVCVWQGLPSLEWSGEGPFRSWVLGIARNVARAHYRAEVAGKRDVRRDVRLGADSARGHADGDGPMGRSDASPHRRVRRAERFQRLKNALLELSSDYRDVIVLMSLQGLSSKQTASRMGRSPKAVSMLHVRALRALRAVFGDTESLGLPESRLRLEERPGED